MGEHDVLAVVTRGGLDVDIWFPVIEGVDVAHIMDGSSRSAKRTKQYAQEAADHYAGAGSRRWVRVHEHTWHYIETPEEQR